MTEWFKNNQNHLKKKKIKILKALQSYETIHGKHCAFQTKLLFSEQLQVPLLIGKGLSVLKHLSCVLNIPRESSLSAAWHSYLIGIRAVFPHADSKGHLPISSKQLNIYC